jgi:hypothetical protein
VSDPHMPAWGMRSVPVSPAISILSDGRQQRLRKVWAPERIVQYSGLFTIFGSTFSVATMVPGRSC